MPKNAFDKSRNRQKISLALRRGQIWLHYKHRWWQPKLIIFSHGSRQVWPMLYLFYCGPAQLITDRCSLDFFFNQFAVASETFLPCYLSAAKYNSLISLVSNSTTEELIGRLRSALIDLILALYGTTSVPVHHQHQKSDCPTCCQSAIPFVVNKVYRIKLDLWPYLGVKREEMINEKLRSIVTHFRSRYHYYMKV